MVVQIKLSPKLGTAPTNQAASRALPEMPIVDYRRTVDKMPNGSKDTFDGYEFKTDWNGSSNPMATDNGNIFSTDHDRGLRFYTTDTIGKDRKLYYQYWDRSVSNMWLPNVIGFTGLWRHNHPQTHTRLAMVCFHYMDKDGNRAGDYRPTEALRGHSESNHYWNYDNSGQHDSGVDWWIGYQLSPTYRSRVFNSQMYLMGMSFQFVWRTSASARHADCRYWNFKPIIAESATGSASLQSAATCQTGRRLVIPAQYNTYPRSGNSIKIT